MLGGEINVKSTPGVGSTFSFTSVHNPPTVDELAKFLRAAKMGSGNLTEVPLGASLPASITEPQLCTSPKFGTLVICEDNPINLKHLAKHVKMLGYQSILCTNGKEALDKFCEPDSIIEAVIMDMSMPVMGKSFPCVNWYSVNLSQMVWSLRKGCGSSKLRTGLAAFQSSHCEH